MCINIKYCSIGKKTHAFRWHLGIKEERNKGHPKDVWESNRIFWLSLHTYLYIEIQLYFNLLVCELIFQPDSAKMPELKHSYRYCCCHS